jgi:hypothetical protein
MTAVAVAASMIGGVAIGASAWPAAAAAPRPAVQMIAQGLNNPRNMTWGPNGEMLISESGTGGGTCFGTSTAQMCMGLTGSVAAMKNAKLTTVVSGLLSMEAQDQGMAYPKKVVMGLAGIDYYHGTLYGIMDASSSGTMPPSMPSDMAVADYNQLGRLLVLKGHGPMFPIVADPGDYDWAWTYHNINLAPTNFPDSNPYALLVDPGVTYTINASSNTLDAVYPDGTVKFLAFIPNAPVGDGVPDCVAQKGGNLYIGQLTAGGNAAGSANVYRYNIASKKLTVWLKGFSAITGCGFGKNGDFYVTEFDTTGWPPANVNAPAGAVIQIAPNGKRTVLGNGKLFAPNGFLAGPDGSIYVANWSILSKASNFQAAGTTAPGGTVVKISP